MPSRIQRTNNSLATPKVTIGYTPNKSSLQPLVGAVSGLDIPSQLRVNALTASGPVYTDTVYAGTVIANTIVAQVTLSGTTQEVYTSMLSGNDITTGNLTVDKFLYNKGTKITSGPVFPINDEINFSFAKNNNTFIFAKDGSNQDYVVVYNTFSVNTPKFLLSSTQIAPIGAFNKYALKDSYLYYGSDDQDGLRRIYAYNLNVENTSQFLSAATSDFMPFNTGIENIFIYDNYLYAQCSTPSRLNIYNISNPNSIEFISTINLYGREIVGGYNNYIFTHATVLTGGNYIDLIGIIDVINKGAPYRYNEKPFDFGAYYKPTQYLNYFYRTVEDHNLSASRIYFYKIEDLFETPFTPTFNQYTSSNLQGYENLGSKNLQNNELYIASTGTKGSVLSAYPKGFSVWNFQNVTQPISSYFWNYTEGSAGPAQIVSNYNGSLIATANTLSSLQLFYTYGANFDSIKASRINSDSFDTLELNTQNVNFFNSAGVNLTAVKIVSNDVLPVLPAPKIGLGGIKTNLTYGANSPNQLSLGGTFTLERSPELLPFDLTEETLARNNIFLEMVIFKKKKGNNVALRAPSYSYLSTGTNLATPWSNQFRSHGFWNRVGQPGLASGGVIRTNFLPVTSVNNKMDLSPYISTHLREQPVYYLTKDSLSANDYSFSVNLLCPYGGSPRLTQANPKYGYTRNYKPLYVAFRYIAWLPNSNNGKGQIISGPLSPTIRIANKKFPFHVDHYQSSIKEFPVVFLAPSYVNDLEITKKRFICNFC